MTFEGLEEICEGDSADMNTGKLILVLMQSRAEGLMCACPCARTPIDFRFPYETITALHETTCAC